MTLELEVVFSLGPLFYAEFTFWQTPSGTPPTGSLAEIFPATTLNFIRTGNRHRRTQTTYVVTQ